MSTCIFDGKFSTDGDDPRNWVDAKMPGEGDDVHLRGHLQKWDTKPELIGTLLVEVDTAKIGTRAKP